MGCQRRLTLFCALACLLSSVEAQCVAVTCFINGDEYCNEGNSTNVFPSTYEICCTQGSPTSTYYFLDDMCTRCGPVLRDDAVRVIGVASTSVILEWEMRENSLPVTEFRVAQGETANADEARIPVPLSSTSTSQQFINLDVNCTFDFSIQARGEGYHSPEVLRIFFVGQITRTVVTDITVDTNSSETSATVFWTLVSPGFPPVTLMEIQWIEVPPTFINDSFTVEDVSGDDPVVLPVNGTTFSITFDVDMSTTYLVFVRATNEDNTNEITFYVVFDSEGTVPPTVVVDVPEGLSGGKSATIHSLLLIMMAAVSIAQMAL